MNEENNKLILIKFLGGEILSSIHYKNKHGILCRIDGDKYETSWSWLMPIVEYIESIGYMSEISENYCEIITPDLVFNSIGETKIKAVYTCVIAFIQWYTLQPKQ